MPETNKIKEYMIKWTINYVKNKDLLAKEIVSLEKHNEELYVKFKNKEQFFLMLPTINDVDEIVHKIREKQNLTIIVLNSGENFDIIVKNWKRFIDFQKFTIIFINPFSNLDKKWILSPYIHNKICDNTSLITGLKSIFNTVDSINEDQIKALISNTRK